MNDESLGALLSHMSEKIAALEDDNAELRGEVEHWHGRYVDAHAEALVTQTKLQGMTVEQGAVELSLAPPRELVIAWVNAAREFLGEAENYSETRLDFPKAHHSMEFKAAGEIERYVFTVQRAHKMTPHEARKKAEAQLEELRVAVAGYLAARFGLSDLADAPVARVLEVLARAAEQRRDLAERQD